MKLPKPTKNKKKPVSKRIKNYEQLWHYLYDLQGGMCVIAESKGEWKTPEEIHHRLHNRKINRHRFPLFIDSVFNCVLVNHDMHMQYPTFGKLPVFQADKIEQYIIAHPESIEIGYFKSKVELEECIKEILNG